MNQLKSLFFIFIIFCQYQLCLATDKDYFDMILGSPTAPNIAGTACYSASPQNKADSIPSGISSCDWIRCNRLLQIKRRLAQLSGNLESLSPKVSFSKGKASKSRVRIDYTKEPHATYLRGAIWEYRYFQNYMSRMGQKIDPITLNYLSREYNIPSRTLERYAKGERKTFITFQSSEPSEIPAPPIICGEFRPILRELVERWEEDQQ